VLRPGGDHAAIFRIVDHQIRIAAHGNRALARKQAKEFCRASAGGVDKSIEVQSTSLYAEGVQKIDAVLNAGNAVGIFTNESLPSNFCSVSNGQ